MTFDYYQQTELTSDNNDIRHTLKKNDVLYLTGTDHPTASREHRHKGVCRHTGKKQKTIRNIKCEESCSVKMDITFTNIFKYSFF